MSALAEEFVEVAGARTRVVQGGPEREPILFLHGGAPGATLYCSGAHIWSPCLPLFASARRVAALDLPGFGETPAPQDGASIDRAGRFALALIDALRLAPCHLVGHDEGGLIALWAALEAPAKFRSVSVAAGAAAAPSGDSVASLALLNPPRPLWSRAAQAWAFERLSYTPHHIAPGLLDRCAACADAPPHRTARPWPVPARAFSPASRRRKRASTRIAANAHSRFRSSWSWRATIRSPRSSKAWRSSS